MRSLILFLVLYLLVNNADLLPIHVCVPDSKCSCTSVDGYYDLHPLANTDNTSRFTDIKGPDGYTYSYNPCYGFNQGEGDSRCSDTAVCQQLPESDDYIPLGYAKKLLFVASSMYGLLLEYKANTDINRTASVILICDPNIEGEVDYLKFEPPSDYYFNLRSKYACPKEKPSSQPPPSPFTSQHSKPAHHKHHSKPSPGHPTPPGPGHPTPPRPGHPTPPRPGHHTPPTPGGPTGPTSPPPPPPSPSFKYFNIESVVILLLCILVVLTILCGLVIWAVCYFSAKVSPGKQSEKAEECHSVNSEYKVDEDTRKLKHDF